MGRAVAVLRCTLLAFALAACALQPAPPQARTYRILITNDDGIEHEGITALAAALGQLGEVVVVAPKTDQSGKSHSISILNGVASVMPVMRDGVRFGYAVDGTPADCVLLALYWPPIAGKFDVVVSGINYGTNVGVASLYSGTVGATVEGALADIPSVAFSQDARLKEYGRSAAIAAKIVERVLKEGVPSRSFLNVNIPAGELKGFRVAPMGDSFYVLDRFETFGAASDGSTGVKLKLKRGTEFLPERDTDLYADGYVTLTPLQADWTARDFIESLQKWSLELPAASAK